MFYKKELQNTYQKEFRIEKVINRKGDKLYVNWKSYDNSFNSWTDKKDIVKKIEVQSDFFNYTTKSDLKNARDVDTSYFAKNTDLASLKSEVDKLYIGKLKTTPVDISKNTVL